MKILHSFDTKLDEKELLDAINRHGKGNALLIKRHWIFLVAPLAWLLLAIAVFWLSIYFSYYQYYAIHPFLFRIVSGAQSAVTLVWIIHSIQVIIYTINKNKGIVFFDQIDAVDLKTGKFEIYLIHSFISFLLQIILLFTDIVLGIIFKVTGFTQRIVIAGETFLNFLFLLGMFLAVLKIIDYEMDFSIFTPEQFVIYVQHGLLRTESISIATSSIKMVKETKEGFWGALWGYGKISIHPEGGANQSAPVTISYVIKPKMLARKLNTFIDESKKVVVDPLKRL